MMFSDSEYTDDIFSSIDVNGETLRFKSFENCTFNRCRCNNVNFVECRFRDCRFTGCDLSLATVRDCTFVSTSFKDTKLVGINWTEANWPGRSLFRPVAFEGCTLNYGTFIGLRLQKLTLSHCVAHDVDFSEADLTGADCRHTDFTDSRFHHTDLTEADFVQAHHYSINAGTNTLKKTRFALPEAISLLRSLDIVLVDDDSAAS